MCGPFYLWKYVNYIASICIVIIGIAMIPTFNYVATFEIVKAIEYENQVKAFGIAFGAILIIAGSTGWLSIYCRSKCVGMIYLIFLIVLALAFAGVWIAIQSILGSKKSDLDKICEDAKQSGWLDDIKMVYPDSICGETPTFYLPKCYPNAPATSHVCSNGIKLQECNDGDKDKIYGVDKHPTKVYVELAKYLEEEQNCMGICTMCPYLMYTDCNKDKNAKSCDKVLIDLITGIIIYKDDR